MPKCLMQENQDPEGYRVSKGELDKSLIRVLKIIGERADGKPGVIVNRNSVIWAGKSRWNWG